MRYIFSKEVGNNLLCGLSFDQFSSYEQRGNTFVEIFNKLELGN